MDGNLTCITNSTASYNWSNSAVFVVLLYAEVFCFLKELMISLWCLRRQCSHCRWLRHHSSCCVISEEKPESNCGQKAVWFSHSLRWYLQHIARVLWVNSLHVFNLSFDIRDFGSMVTQTQKQWRNKITLWSLLRSLVLGQAQPAHGNRWSKLVKYTEMPLHWCGNYSTSASDWDLLFLSS